MRLPRKLGHGQPAELVEHLDELRSRLIVSLVAIAAGFTVAYIFRGQLLDWLNAGLPSFQRHPVTFGVAEPFLTSFKISLLGGAALALPVLLWQAWSFLAPALDKKLERSINGFVLVATALFAAGVMFADKIALPSAIHYLTSYDASHYTILIRAQDYYSFVITVLVAVGIIFELPIFILALVRIGALSSQTLRRKRRIGYAAMAVLAVALPGVDPITTSLEMIPLMLLFEASIWLSVLFERRWHPTPNLAANTT